MNGLRQKVLVIGGGFAGLSAATALVEAGFHVTLVEGRQVLGGRAYSFVDSKTGDSVDNGQHLFMRCYRETLRFLDRIGTRDRLRFQTNLTVDFVGDHGRQARLRCWPLPAPWHLFGGLARLSTITWGDRFRLSYMREALRQASRSKEALDHLTVDQWLTQWRQSERVRRNLWDLIAVAALNEDPKIAAASSFSEVLSRAFFGGRQESHLGFSTVGLSDLFASAAEAFLQRHGGEIHLRAPVDRLHIREGRVTGAVLREGTRLEADWVISSLPAWSLLKILPPEVVEAEPVFRHLKKLQPSPIISIHLWFDRAISRRLFAGMLDTHVQWFFNKSRLFDRPRSREGYVSVVISGAHSFAGWSDTALLSMALEELHRVFPRARSAVLLRSLVIKEHQATLSPGVGIESIRPESRSPLRNLLLAGDWTKTGLPATIESACVSGHACAEIIQKTGAEAPELFAEVAHA